MEELSQALKALDLECPSDDDVEYDFPSVFKNPNKLPINQIHLEHVTFELRKNISLEVKSDDIAMKCFNRKNEVIPALDKRWLPNSQPFFKFEPYNFALRKEENVLFTSKNLLFLKSLKYLLKCNYHQFWCLVLFNQEVGVGLHSFVTNPLLPHQLDELDRESSTLYLLVYSHFLLVYQRLITFKESSYEYMPDDVGMKYLLEKKLLTLPIVLTLILLYQEVSMEFVNKLTSLYFREESVFRDKEIEETLDQIIMTLEMIGGHVCGFEPGSVIVPIAIEERPKVFNLNWISSVVNYLLNTISILNILFRFHKQSKQRALEKGVPYRLPFTYERIFFNLYNYLWERKELEENPRLSQLIFEEIALARSEYIDVYNCFISYCLDKVLEFSGNLTLQEEFVEIYLKLLQEAIEDEYFICDYHEKYDVGAQNEMFVSCTELDSTRTDYFLNCINNFKRHNRIWKVLKCERKTLMKAIEKYTNMKKIEEMSVQGEIEPQPESSKIENNITIIPSEVEIEDSIKTVIDMFPHLGDGFVLKCLEAYDYQAVAVIAAILDGNLPLHIVDIPMDLIRIPPEPKPAEPILAYRGKKPGYEDAMQLLNDKKDMKEIKTYILDGIQYTDEYDVYDDEYDDRQDEETVPVRDHGSEDILKFNPNYDDAVSDTSYSEEEYDEKGQLVPNTSDSKSKGKGDFCEDPALIRERREARLRSQRKIRDVVGKTKGQGQSKEVLQNRQKKNVQKSSRANHNRKGGAQWKRNKGMIPS